MDAAQRPVAFDLGDEVARLAQDEPDAIAVKSDTQTMTYGELDERAGQLAAALEEFGVSAGSRVVHLDYNATEAAELLVAAARLGAVFTPLNWRLSEPELVAVMRDAQPRAMLAGPTFSSLAEALVAEVGGVGLITYGDSRPAPWENGPRSPTRHSASADDVVTQVYTSGTTGMPKGVMLTAANMSARVDDAPVTFRVRRDSCVLVALPLFHIGGLAPLITALHAGARSIIVPQVVPEDLLETLEREQVTTAMLVPTVLHILTEVAGAADRDWSHLEHIGYGGSPIPTETLKAALRTFQCEFTGMYGATEMSSTAVRLDWEDHDPDGPRSHLLRSVGRPLSGMELEIVDDQGAVLPPRSVGEIRVRGPLVMAGYFRQEEQTRAVLSEDGWLRSGDAGYIDEDGYVFVTDRVKDMIISGGENVYSIEVEEVLSKHPGVAEVAVIGIPHPKWVEVVAAVIVPEQNYEIDPEELTSFARRELAGYKLPRVVKLVSELPKTPSGKVVKTELRKRYREDGEA
jgi:acyl-CoA synthetase (AMP-forming)/AMP-acid ligase II